MVVGAGAEVVVVELVVVEGRAIVDVVWAAGGGKLERGSLIGVTVYPVQADTRNTTRIKGVRINKA